MPNLKERLRIFTLYQPAVRDKAAVLVLVLLTVATGFPRMGNR